MADINDRNNKDIKDEKAEDSNASFKGNLCEPGLGQGADKVQDENNSEEKAQPRPQDETSDLGQGLDQKDLDHRSEQTPDLAYSDPADDKDQVYEENQGIVATILSVIGNVIFALFLIIILAILVLNLFSFARGDQISLFGRQVYIIGEDTMAPLLREDDGIIVYEAGPQDVNSGDLIVYETTDGQAVTAWVSDKLEEDRLEIKKDINSSDAIVIDGIALIGLAGLRVANLGEFLDFITNPISLLIIFLVGIIIYIIIWYISSRLRRRQEV